jgi:hypothetical protein
MEFLGAVPARGAEPAGTLSAHDVGQICEAMVARYLGYPDVKSHNPYVGSLAWSLRDSWMPTEVTRRSFAVADPTLELMTGSVKGIRDKRPGA